MGDSAAGEKTVVVEQSADMLRVSGTKRTIAEALGASGQKRRKTNASTKPFSVSEFKASLSHSGDSPTEAELLALECDTLHESWLQLVAPELRKDYFLKLKRMLWAEGARGKDTPKSSQVFPQACDIYSWSQLPLDKVKCVILGQDPYHNDGQAHGLSFSVKPGVAVPPSLRNIYKEIKSDYPEFIIPKHGYLEAWAKQGVLCLNSSLTVRAHQANSHSKKGWEKFTDAVIGAINKQGGSGLSNAGGGVVFLAWGNNAKQCLSKVDKKHLVLASAHPSPLSAHRGFFGNGHFKKTNEWLKERHGEDAVIDWTAVSQE